MSWKLRNPAPVGRSFQKVNVVRIDPLAPSSGRGSDSAGDGLRWRARQTWMMEFSISHVLSANPTTSMYYNQRRVTAYAPLNSACRSLQTKPLTGVLDGVLLSVVLLRGLRSN